MAFEIVKAGWMLRLSSILRRWKKNWVVLYKDGNLKYFDNPDSHVAEECIVLHRECIRIETGKAITDSDPPEGCSKSFMLALQLRDTRLVFSAESPDDMSAWQIALEQARVVRGVPCQQRPPPYSPNMTVPGDMYYGAHPPPYVAGQQCNCRRAPTPALHGAQVDHVVENPDGTRTNVVYIRDQGCRRCHHDGSDMALGMVAGAAVGTMMWGPLLWW